MERTSVALPGWLEEALINPKITDLCLNGSHGAFMDRGQGMELIPDSLSWGDDSLRQWVLDLLSLVGKTWDAKHPFVDATLPSGHRLHATFPPLSPQGLLISLRRLPTRTHFKRWEESPLYVQLAQAVEKGDSVLISGATGSGKTTLAGDLLCHAPDSERIIALEDTSELCTSHPHFIRLLSRPPNADGFGEVTLRTLLRQTLRMRPDRIVLGECRGMEVLDLLQALNTGHRGAMATLHANSPRDALRRVELLCLLASGGSIPIPAIRELIANGVQWVAQVRRNAQKRTISELWGIEGREGDTILMRPVVEMKV